MKIKDLHHKWEHSHTDEGYFRTCEKCGKQEEGTVSREEYEPGHYGLVVRYDICDGKA